MIQVRDACELDKEQRLRVLENAYKDVIERFTKCEEENAELRARERARLERENAVLRAEVTLLRKESRRKTKARRALEEEI